MGPRSGLARSGLLGVSNTIDITGIPKPQLLAALFNASKQQGLGFLDASGAAQMTTVEAETAIKEYGANFDYLKGRVMKVDISGDELRVGLYDRDNGEGAAARAVGGITS